MSWKAQILIGLVVSVLGGIILFFVQSFFDDEQLSEKLQQEYAHHFLNVVNKYCVNYRNQLNNLVKGLENGKDENFTKFYGTDGTYETLVGGISIAITPEFNRCTTDLRLRQFGNTLFTYTQIDNLIQQRSGLTLENSVRTTDADWNENEVQVIKNTYVSDNDEKWVMVYPLDHLDTFFFYIDVYCTKC
jgi:hypothetical protein